MKRAKKRVGKIVRAGCLGMETPIIKELTEKAVIERIGDGKWRVLSRESTVGEIVEDGDFVKIDSEGFPYPNKREFFLANHKPIELDLYEQIPKEVLVWERTQGTCSEVEYLIKKQGLIINPKNKEKYFMAPLWGDVLTADENAVLIIYQMKRDDHGQLEYVDYNFVAREEFDKDYIWIK